jgi:hypothetical protein
MKEENWKHGWEKEKGNEINELKNCKRVVKKHLGKFEFFNFQQIIKSL